MTVFRRLHQKQKVLQTKVLLNLQNIVPPINIERVLCNVCPTARLVLTSFNRQNKSIILNPKKKPYFLWFLS